MTSVQVSIITVNFGGSDKIKALRDSLAKNPPKISWEWIVVDNFSSEAEVQKLKNLLHDFPHTHVINLSQNYGYGIGNREGVQFAKGEYLAIVNPDVEVISGCFESLLQNIENTKNVGICVPVLQTQTGFVLKNTRKFPNVGKILWRRVFGHAPASDPEKVRSVDWAQGSFWLLRKSLFEEMNGFDDRFFLFFEDTDFCRRLKGKGLKVLQIPSARAIHSPNRLSGGNIFVALFRKTFWIHLISMVKYFWKWRKG